MSIRQRKILIKTSRYTKRVFTALSIIFMGFFFISASGNNSHITYSDINEAMSEEPSISYNIEDYNIAAYFEYSQTGNASWYGKRFHNRRTASGERYNMYELSAAHKKLPMGSIVRVTNERTGETVLLRINDRGPYVKRRIIDLSYHASKFVSGATNPKVEIETLLAEDNYDIIPDDDEYYFGYSFDLPLVCLPSKVIEFISTTEDFDEAVDIYNQTLEENPGQYVYLFSKAGKINYKYNNLKEEYSIGIFNPEIRQINNNNLDIVDN